MVSDIQRGLLTLLKEIDDICTRHDIDFYLAGGSMVGAVRHAGFLPWDDDADIHMTKENAEKFVSLADEFLPGRIVVSKNTHLDYSAVHWRYMNTNQTTMLRSSFFTEVPQGQFIDIFILNPITNDIEQHDKILHDYLVYSEWVVNHFSTNSVRDDAFFEEYAALREREKTEGFDNVRRSLEKELFEYPAEKSDYYLIRSPIATHPIFPKELWGRPRRVPFEDCTMPVAEKAEEVLMLAYGERWVDIPEMTDQISHVFVSDQMLPYHLYDEEIKKFADKKSMLKCAYDKKDIWFAHAIDRNHANSRARAASQFDIMQLLEGRAQKWDLAELVEEKDYSAIKSLFQPYYKAQFQDYKYYGMYFDMPEDYMYAALLPLVIQGKYNKAKGVLEKRASIKGDSVDPKLAQMTDFCRDAAQLTNDLYVYHDYQDALALVRKWLPVYPDCLTLLRAEVFLMIELKEKDTDSIREMIMTDLRLYVEDGELIKYMGDTYRDQGDNEKACRYYRRALATISNGLLMTEIKKYLERSEHA